MIENMNTFMFNSLTFTTGLLIYTFILYVSYYIFLSGDNSSIETENEINKETIKNKTDEDFLEDVLEDVL